MNEKFKTEAVVAVLERTIRRLWILALVLIAVCAISNGCWIYYESQFTEVETVTTEIDADQETDDGGDNMVVGGDYGETTCSY